MSEIRLVRPEGKYKTSYLEGITELVEEGYLRGKLDLEYLSIHFDDYLNKISQFEKGEGLPNDFSPQSEFWLVKDSVKYIGTLKIRHRLGNEYLKLVGGHVGYYIRPSERSIGYGNLILSLGLKEARRLGLRKILITCSENNLKSQKVIESNGGIYESKASHIKTGGMMRYWFAL